MSSQSSKSKSKDTESSATSSTITLTKKVFDLSFIGDSKQMKVKECSSRRQKKFPSKMTPPRGLCQRELLESSGDHSQGQLIKQRNLPANKKSRKKECSYSTISSLDDENFAAQPLLKQRLGYLYERKKYTDVVFLVGRLEEKVEAHRTILASASTTFQKMFYESKSLFLEDDDKFVVREPDCSVDSFKVFIKGIYTNEIPISLNLSMSLDVFNLTEKYGVTFLQDAIVSHIQNSVTVSNIFEALKVSTRTMRLTCMIPVCWKIVEEHTSAVLEHHIETLDPSTFTRILERDQLNLEEIELFQFMVKWAAVQCKRRALKTTGRNKRQMLEPFLKYIRFTNMGMVAFNDVVLPSRILEPKEIHDIVTHLSKHPELENASSNPKTPAKTNKRSKKSIKSERVKSSIDLTRRDSKHTQLTSESAIVVQARTPTTPTTKLRTRKSTNKTRVTKRGSVSHR